MTYLYVLLHIFIKMVDDAKTVYKYPNFPSKSEQMIMILLLEKKVMTFYEQEIYSNRLSFKSSMKKLHDLKLVLCHHSKNASNQYKLTAFGEHVAEILKRFQVKK